MGREGDCIAVCWESQERMNGMKKTTSIQSEVKSKREWARERQLSSNTIGVFSASLPLPSPLSPPPSFHRNQALSLSLTSLMAFSFFFFLQFQRPA